MSNVQLIIFQSPQHSVWNEFQRIKWKYFSLLLIGWFQIEYRVLFFQFALLGSQNSPYTGQWRELPGSPTRLYILQELSFESGKTYEVKIRAVNAAKLTSPAVSTKVMIHSKAPVISKGKRTENRNTGNPWISYLICSWSLSEVRIRAKCESAFPLGAIEKKLIRCRTLKIFNNNNNNNNCL